MAEVDRLREISEREVAVAIVDAKACRVEAPEEVAAVGKRRVLVASARRVRPARGA